MVRSRLKSAGETHRANRAEDTTMSILVIGSTGTIGSQVVGALAERGAEVHALCRNPEKQKFPDGVVPVQGDLLDMDAMRAALAKTRTLFLLNAVSADELTKSLLTLKLAGEAGIERIVYFSMIRTDVLLDTPHASAKYATELMIQKFGIAATILRPAYFYQNDAMVREPVVKGGVYPVPLGGVGVSMVDARDIAEVAALELLKRDKAAGPLPSETIEIAGPEVFTGASLAAIWSEAAGKPVSYGGDDLEGFEARFKAMVPSWMAYDLRLMFGWFQREGMLAQPGTAERIEAMLGRPLRAYRDFAREILGQGE